MFYIFSTGDSDLLRQSHNHYPTSFCTTWLSRLNTSSSTSLFAVVHKPLYYSFECITHLNQHHHIIWPKMISTPSVHKQTLPSNTIFGAGFSAGSMLGVCLHCKKDSKQIYLHKPLESFEGEATFSHNQCAPSQSTAKWPCSHTSSLKSLFSWYITNVNKTKENIWSHNNPALLNTPGICWSCIPIAGTCLGSLGKQVDGNVSSKVYIFFPWWKGSFQGWFRHELQEMRNVLANAQGSVHIHCMFLSTVPCSISYFTTGSSLNHHLLRTNKT